MSKHRDIKEEQLTQLNQEIQYCKGLDRQLSNARTSNLKKLSQLLLEKKQLEQLSQQQCRERKFGANTTARQHFFEFVHRVRETEQPA